MLNLNRTGEDASRTESPGGVACLCPETTGTMSIEERQWDIGSDTVCIDVIPMLSTISDVLHQPYTGIVQNRFQAEIQWNEE